MAIVPNLSSVTTGPADNRALRVFSETANDAGIISGTDNGQPDGNNFIFVNNVKEQILATDDRSQVIAYEDFGNKNQRIISITYTSARFPSIAAVKNINYTLVSNRYRRDEIIWSVQNV